MKVYPIFLNDLEGRRCVVIGGGHEGERKTLELLDTGAAVVIVSESVTPAVESVAAEGRLIWHHRAYRRGDLRDAFLVIVAETNPAATAPIWEEAQAEKVLINAMDDVPHCTFVAGSVVRRGPLVVSISSSGTAPTLAVRLRQRLEKIVTQAHGTLAEWMGSLRDPMARQYPDFTERKERWYRLVDSDVLPLIESGNLEAACDLMQSILGEEVVQARDHQLPAAA